MFRNWIQLGQHRDRDEIAELDIRNDFIAERLKLLNPTTVSTAIYILSCLYPEDFTVILELLRFDLSQPHHHPFLSRKHLPINFRSSKNVVSSLQRYARILPAKEYRHLWLEMVEHWLLTCTIDEEYYKPRDTEQDLFCPKLRSELLDSILNIT